MLLSMYYIKDSILRIENMIPKIGDDQDVDTFNINKARAIGCIYNLALGLEEASLTLKNNSIVNRLYNRVIDITKGLINITTPSDFRGVLNSITDMFKGFDYQNSTNYTEYNRFAYNYVYETEVRKYLYAMDNYDILEQMCHMIEAPHDRNINIFCPDSSGSDMAATFNMFSNRKLYVTDNTQRINTSKERAYKVGKGPLVGTRIQNDSFDIVQVFPFTKHNFDNNTFYVKNNIRKEKEYIQDCFKYLRPGGVMIIALPIYRLYQDVCSMISKYLKNVKVIKMSNIEFNSIGLVYIIGVKDYIKSERESVYHYLRSMFDYQRASDIYELIRENYKILLPEVEIPITLFKGSVLDLDEVESIFDNTLSLDNIIDKQRVTKMNENTKKPLLPFNIGQIGLILTSGCLDGVVQEDGGCHLIKGRVSKEKNISRDVEGDSVNQTEIESNRIEINILLPNGEYKKLI